MDDPARDLQEDEDLIRFRDCFSVKYIQSAALFCRLGFAIESDYAVTGTRVCRCSGSGTRRLSSTQSSLRLHFLESTINELWSDAADNAYFFSDKNNEALLQAIGEKWNNENYFDRTPLPVKYQKVLEIGNKPLFLEDDPVFSGIKDLIAIRNYLMHYRREWVTIQTGQTPGAAHGAHAEKFEHHLKNRFSGKPIRPQKPPVLPGPVSRSRVC